MIRSPIVDMNNRFNEVFPLFDSYNSKFFSGTRIIDILSSCFSFHPLNKHSKDNLTSRSCQLDNLAIMSSENSSYTLVVTNTSIKFNVAISITHIHICNKPVVKILYHAVNVTSTEAKIFTIRCGINQATTSQGILKIIVITDLIHSAKRIFDPLLHPFQLHATSILSELGKFFTHNPDNSIEFWEYPS